MYRVDLNADLGESFGTYQLGMDEEVLSHITSANVACGWHAGDAMTMQQTASYIWLQQALLALFMPWGNDQEIFGYIREGNVAYELARPMDLYSMWFARNIALRASRAVLRCFPVILFAMLLPAPYGLMLPQPGPQTLYALVSCLLSLHLVVAFNMLAYIVTFWTISPQGVNILFQSSCDILSGQLIPIPFMPLAMQQAVRLSPFAYMQDVPLRIYSGSIAGTDIAWSMAGQAMWLCILLLAGRLLMARALRRVVVQGG